MKKLKLVGILVAVVLIGGVISISFINNNIAYKVEKELCETPLPEKTELIESISRAGKLTGNGAPSHAAEAMEMGASACLVNTAIAVAGDPVEMAKAFKEAVVCGRRAYEAGLGAISDCAEASSPLTAFLND